MTAKEFGDAKLHCVDLGARAGMPEHWQPYAAHLTIDAFEPDEQALDKGYKQKEGATWFPIGLARHSGRAKFFVLGGASGSSLYPPNEPVISQYSRDRYWRLRETRELPFLSFSDYIAKYDRPTPELIKLDTQGSELDILSSLDDAHWPSVLVVETEVEFLELYKGQPMFRDVDAFLAAKGFELLDLRTHRAYLHKGDSSDHYLRQYFDLAELRTDYSARLLAGDAIYIRAFPDGVPESADTVRKLALALCIYHYFDHAALLAERAEAAGRLTAADKEALIADIVARAPRPGPAERASGTLRRILVGLKHIRGKLLGMVGLRVARRGQHRVGWSLRSWPDQ